MAQAAEQITWRLHDRIGEPSGPWDAEPDRIAWTDPDTGYPALMRRNQFGSWCGYVAVPPGHCAHGCGYDGDVLYDVDVHGGLTYAASCQGDPLTGVCHVPADGEPDDVWWLGFDCGHAWDHNWMMARLGAGFDMGLHAPAEYRDVGYVKQEVSRLAQQLKELNDVRRY